jgi:hypothetical protein
MQRLIPTPFLLATLLLMACGPTAGFSQEKADFITANFQRALKMQTRSIDGLPGPTYWQNRADYDIDVSFDPASRQVKGSGTITYQNDSDQTLSYLLLMLLPDLYKQGNPRDFPVLMVDEHPGILIHSLEVNSKRINPSRINNSEMLYESTYAWIDLPEPLQPGSALNVSVTWEYTLNKGSHMRTGQVDSSSFFVAYWFPRIGVYDDIEGWNPYAYTGVGEFYNDFGDFNVRITVPEGYIVWATGELQNPGSVFSDDLLKRYKEAKKSLEPVRVIGKNDLGKQLTLKGPTLEWAFMAENVNDFAFGLSDHYLWDALIMKAGQMGSKVFVSTAYHEESLDFYKVINMAQTAIAYMTEELPGLPFPYPSITVFNGLDEMEYPMMVNDLSFKNLDESFKLTAHEICHSYFPFLTGCNERKYAWMDEGLTSFFEYNLIRDLVDSTIISVYFLEEYLDIIGSEKDLPLFTSSEVIRSPDYYSLSYPKAVCFYSVLMEETGRDRFRAIIHEFASRWKGKHPTGHDFLNTISSVLEQDMAWLIRPWFFEFGTVDLGIGEVKKTETGYSVAIEKWGNLPAPIRLTARYADGTTEVLKRKPSVWSDGKQHIIIEIDATNKLEQLELMQDIPFDANSENDFYRL